MKGEFDGFVDMMLNNCWWFIFVWFVIVNVWDIVYMVVMFIKLLINLVVWLVFSLFRWNMFLFWFFSIDFIFLKVFLLLDVMMFNRLFFVWVGVLFSGVLIMFIFFVVRLVLILCVDVGIEVLKLIIIVFFLMFVIILFLVYMIDLIIVEVVK